eukprot:gene6207-biopygen6246
MKVTIYLYQDISASSQAVARASCAALVRRYPDLLSPDAVELEVLPSDLRATTVADFIRAGAPQGQQWVMVCGFPCQDFSPAGTLKGLAGRHSKLFYEVVRLLSTLQQLQRQRPPAGYILENVSPLAHRPGTRIRDEVFPYIAGVIGQPVSFDAARAGSYAHRLRAYWSNLFQNYQFRSVMSKVVRPEDRAGADSEEETREVNLDEKSRAMGYSASELRMADGLSDEELAKRVVRTIKFCFKKFALEKGLDYEWDELLWSLVLIYNAARQESTGVAPFTLLFAQEAVVPPDLKKAPNLKFDLEVNDDKDHRVKDLLQRAQKPRSGMEVAAKLAILKLVKIQRDGVVVLEDAARLREKSTVQSIAPCHLQVKDPYLTAAQLYPANIRLHVKCSGTGMQAAHAEVLTQESKTSRVLEDRLGMKEQQLNEKLSSDMRLLPADVGPRRVVKGSRSQPWQAFSSRDILQEEKDLFLHMPDQVDWGKQDKLSEMVRIFMPGHWNEGHRTVLSKKYREQKTRARQLRNAPLVPALAEEEIEKRGELRHMPRAQVREASALQWGLELIITVPSEVRRLATEVDWKSIDGVWDPWAGTGLISE